MVRYSDEKVCIRVYILDNGTIISCLNQRDHKNGDHKFNRQKAKNVFKKVFSEFLSM